MKLKIFRAIEVFNGLQSMDLHDEDFANIERNFVEKIDQAKLAELTGPDARELDTSCSIC